MPLISTKDGLKRDFSFLFRTGGQLPIFLALWGPKVPQAWLLRGQSPYNFGVSSPFFWPFGGLGCPKLGCLGDKAPITLAYHPRFFSPLGA